MTGKQIADERKTRDNACATRIHPNCVHRKTQSPAAQTEESARGGGGGAGVRIHDSGLMNNVTTGVASRSSVLSQFCWGLQSLQEARIVVGYPTYFTPLFSAAHPAAAHGLGSADVLGPAEGFAAGVAVLFDPSALLLLPAMPSLACIMGSCTS